MEYDDNSQRKRLQFVVEIPLEMQREMQWEIGDVARRGGKSKSKSQLVVATIVRCIIRLVAAAATTIVVT